jgi:hypothetical protein
MLGMRGEPISEVMNAAAYQTIRPHGPDLLLRHCLALSAVNGAKPSAKLRLEHALGPELTRRLLTSLTATSTN